MSTTSSPLAPAAPAPTLTNAQPAAPSLSPTTSSRSQNSPSMPSSSSSHPNLAHSLSPSESNERQIAEARAFLAASMNNIGSSLDRTLQERAKNLHDNSKVLEKQQKDVVKATEGLRKENEKLAKMASEGSRKVKELGNVQNWAEMLERDFLVLGEWVRLVDGGSESGSESGSSWTDSDGEDDGEGLDGESGRGKEISGDEEEQRNGENGNDIPAQRHAIQENVDEDGDAKMKDTLHESQHKEDDMAAHGDQQMIDAVGTHADEPMDSTKPSVEHMECHTGDKIHEGANGTHAVEPDQIMEDTPKVEVRNHTGPTSLEHQTLVDGDMDVVDDVAAASSSGQITATEPFGNPVHEGTATTT